MTAAAAEAAAIAVAAIAAVAAVAVVGVAVNLSMTCVNCWYYRSINTSVCPNVVQLLQRQWTTPLLAPGVS